MDRSVAGFIIAAFAIWEGRKLSELVEADNDDDSNKPLHVRAEPDGGHIDPGDASVRPTAGAPDQRPFLPRSFRRGPTMAGIAVAAAALAERVSELPLVGKPARPSGVE